MQDLRSGQARSWALNLERERPKCPGFGGKGGEGFNGTSVFWRKGRDKSKQSASGVLSWAALPPCLWFGRGFCPYLVVVMVVVALWYVCA